MPTPPFYRLLTLVMLLALTVSCAEQTPRRPSPVSPTDSPSTPPPATPTEPVPAPTQKPLRDTKAPGEGQGQGSDASQSLDFTIPEHSLDVILGRPTDTSVTLSLLAYSDQTVAITFGADNAPGQTISVTLTANVPQEITLPNLTPDTSHFVIINNGEQYHFHTARAPGSTFTFTIQADSHLDSNTSAEVYLQTLANQRADNPDFVIDLGDTFMTDKDKPYTAAAPQYLAQRYFLGQLGVPLYLVLGNHDGEGAPRGKDGVEMSAWAAKLRTSLFPNPVSDAFYSGNSGQSYYAFTWGEALFIVLDPYTFTPATCDSPGSCTGRNDSSLWVNTLGAEQYQWLKTTLENSSAKWKFVFIHQLVSGTDKNGRGGVEVANFYEWGGKNPDGSDGFAANRPGWEMPIHQLLVTNHVTAVFHGHDHLFAKEELDGIIYQECPQPGAAHSNTDSAAEYGYTSGDVLGGSGHVRVTVSPDGVTVDYVRTEGGQVAFSYTINP